MIPTVFHCVCVFQYPKELIVKAKRCCTTKTDISYFDDRTKMIQLTLSNGDMVSLKDVSVKKFRGTQVPGGRLFQSSRKDLAISSQEFEQEGFLISMRSLYFENAVKVQILEDREGWRLETVLSGELAISQMDGTSWQLLPGQYHITSLKGFVSEFAPLAGCSYVSIQFTKDFIADLQLPESLQATHPRPLPGAMQDLIFEMLGNQYAPELLSFYYENRVRDLVFEHFSTPEIALPGELTVKQIAAMHELDKYIAANLDSQITMKQLTRITGTNAYYLKKAYFQVFGVRIFPRLIQRRMERAKYLLEKTDKPLKDIFELSGYRSMAGFITEFRMHMGITPNEWRKQRRGSNN